MSYYVRFTSEDRPTIAKAILSAAPNRDGYYLAPTAPDEDFLFVPATWDPRREPHPEYRGNPAAEDLVHPAVLDDINGQVVRWVQNILSYLALYVAEVVEIEPAHPHGRVVQIVSPRTEVVGPACCTAAAKRGKRHGH